MLICTSASRQIYLEPAGETDDGTKAMQNRVQVNQLINHSLSEALSAVIFPHTYLPKNPPFFLTCSRNSKLKSRFQKEETFLIFFLKLLKKELAQRLLIKKEQIQLSASLLNKSIFRLKVF